MSGLKDKTILVTGGSRGIGAAIVEAAIREGAHVVLHYGRGKAAAEALVAASPAGRCLAVPADLSVRGAAQALWQAAVAWQGRIDVLVNNAGIYIPDGADAPTEAWDRAWDETLQVNLRATADLCRLAIRDFRRWGGGAIVNIASRAAFRGDGPDFMAYAASKGATIALTRTIARGHAAAGILCYAVAPGWVRTDMAADFIRSQGEDAAIRDIPLGAMAPAGEVANIVVFLASGKARHATGATFDINGASYVR